MSKSRKNQINLKINRAEYKWTQGAIVLLLLCLYQGKNWRWKSSWWRIEDEDGEELEMKIRMAKHWWWRSSWQRSRSRWWRCCAVDRKFDPRHSWVTSAQKRRLPLLQNICLTKARHSGFWFATNTIGSGFFRGCGNCYSLELHIYLKSCRKFRWL